MTTEDNERKIYYVKKYYNHSNIFSHTKKLITPNLSIDLQFLSRKKYLFADKLIIVLYKVCLGVKCYSF